MAFKRKRSYRSKKRTVKRRRTSYGRKRTTRRSAGRITGFGTYTVKTNTIMTPGSHPLSVYNATSSGGVIVRHREYIGEVVPTAAFTVQYNHPINPGQISTFPWLAGVAENFEEYEMRGLAFHFESTSSDAVLAAAASTALGSVNMATQYNVLNPPFSTLKEMLNYDFGNSCKPSQSMTHYVECARSQTNQTKLWVRPSNTTGDEDDSDRRLYDLGDFILATEGCQGTVGNIGKLWCTYEVELKKPKLLLADDLNELVAYWSSAAKTIALATTQNLFDEANAVFSNSTFLTSSSTWTPFIHTSGATSHLEWNYAFGGRTYNNVSIGDKIEVSMLLYGDAADVGSLNGPVTVGLTSVGAPTGIEPAFEAGDGTRWHMIRYTYTVADDALYAASWRITFTTGAAATTFSTTGLLCTRKLTSV